MHPPYLGVDVLVFSFYAVSLFTSTQHVCWQLFQREQERVNRGGQIFIFPRAGNAGMFGQQPVYFREGAYHGPRFNF